jgi:hypothetical protein
MSLLDTASLVVTPNGTKASKLYSVVPSSGAGDLSVTRATTATRVNSSGLIESVASNVPRLDYTNGTCPSILVEPQRTNTLLQSENLATSWTSFRSVITTNVATSPAGNSTADKIAQQTGIVDAGGVFQTIILGIGTTYTYSYYAKAGGYNWTFARVIDGVNNYYVWFNLATGVVGTIVGSATGKIENAGNGWYRCSVTFNSAGLGNQVVTYVANTDNSDQVPSPDSVKGIFVWGQQLEAGSYATSYIPTTSASVTRNADTSTTSLSSSIINASEGVLFLDYQPLNIIDAYPVDFQLQYNGDNTVNGVTIYHDGDNPAISVRSGGNDIFSAILTATTAGTRNKIAIAYKNNDFAVYQNGVQKAVQTSGVAPALLNQFRLSDGNRHYSINSASIWQTRLTNTQLAQLTTI